MIDGKYQIFLIGFLLLVFFNLLLIYHKFRNITVIRNSKNLNAEELQLKIEQLKIVKLFSLINKNKTEEYIRLSGNPFGLTEPVFNVISYVVPIVLLLFAGVLAIIGTPLWKFLLIIAVLFLWYPTYYYKGLTKEREQEWYKIHNYIFRLEEELIDNNYKTAIENVRKLLVRDGEIEMANGLDYMIECFPDNEDEIQYAQREFEKQYPFTIPSNMFQMIINMALSNSFNVNRLESFKRDCINKYEKYSEKVLNSIPSTATLLSLPFLLASVLAILLVPAFIQILQVLSS